MNRPNLLCDTSNDSGCNVIENSPNILPIKSNDTLSFTVSFVEDKQVNGEYVGIDMTGYSIFCQVRNERNELIIDIGELLPVNAYAGVFEAKTNDTNVKEGTYLADIEIQKNNDKVSSDTFYVQVLKDITQ